MFKALPREQTLAGRVVEQIETLIIDQRLKPGERLPAERELASQFGVSRTVIREAVRSLTAKGLVEVKAGSGSLISSPSAESVSQSLSLFLRGRAVAFSPEKVLEVRRLLEVEIAGLAAQRRSEENLQQLETILGDFPSAKSQRERFVSWDVAFHNGLAEATQNELFPLLLDSISAVMNQVREYGFNIPTTPATAMKFHTDILQQVREQNIPGARKAMERHLTEAEETMRKGMERAAATKGKAAA